jgi:hypothetical protein
MTAVEKIAVTAGELATDVGPVRTPRERTTVNPGFSCDPIVEPFQPHSTAVVESMTVVCRKPGLAGPQVAVVPSNVQPVGALMVMA